MPQPTRGSNTPSARRAAPNVSSSPLGDGGSKDVVRMAIAETQAKAVAMDAYVQVFADWGDPTASDMAALKPYLPNYATHLTNAKTHANSWTTDARPKILTQLADLQAMYGGFSSAQTQLVLRQELSVISNPASTPAQVTAARQNLNVVLNDVITKAKTNIDSTNELQDVLNELSTNIASDEKKLSDDYALITDLDADVKELTSHVTQLNSDKQAATQDLVSSATSTAIGALALAGGALACVIIVCGAETVTAGAATPGFAIALSAVGLGAGVLIGTAPALASATSRLSSIETQLNAANAKLAGENAAIAAASGLSTHFAGFSDAAQKAVVAVNQLADSISECKSDLEGVRDAATTATYDTVDKLTADMAALATQFQTFNADIKRLAALLTTITVQTSSMPAVSSLTAKAA